MLTLRNMKLVVSSAMMLLFLTNCGPVNFTNDENKSEAAKDTTAGITTEIPETQVPDTLPEPNLQTNNPIIDSHLDEVGGIIERIDPHTRRKNIYYVHTSVLVGTKSVDVLVQRQLLENPDLCQINVDTQALFVDVEVQREIPLLRCDGFQRAREVRARNGGACTPKVSDRALNVSVQVANVVDVQLHYELDANCICHKKFDLSVISMRGKGVQTDVEVRAFADAAKCATLFPEYGNTN